MLEPSNVFNLEIQKVKKCFLTFKCTYFVGIGYRCYTFNFMEFIKFSYP